MRHPDQITRARVIDAFRALPVGTAISTLGLAWLIGCIEEYRVRAAVSWLALGGLVELAGEHRRRDRRGRAYTCRLYRWTGREEVRRVPHDPRARRFEVEQEQRADVGALALAWLSRPPPGRAAGPR
jgi:hypothetical protein